MGIICFHTKRVSDSIDGDHVLDSIESIVRSDLPSCYSRTLKQALTMRDVFIPCSSAKNLSTFCQQHYLMVWNSSSLFYSSYKPVNLDNLSDGFTYTVQTS